MAMYLGCRPIILVGQDLSFKPSGATHVEGNVFGHIDEYKKDTLEVEGNYREPLLTTRSFDEGRRSLEVQIRHFDGICINATEGGARIQGTRFLSLRAAIDTCCQSTFDSLDTLKRLWSAEKARQRDTQEELKRTGAIIAKALAELDTAISECRKGSALIAEMQHRYALASMERPGPECLAAVRELTKELNDVRAKIIALPSFVTFEMVIQGYHFDLEMRRHMTNDQFYHREFAEVKSFLLLKEWFATVGQLILSTRHAIEQGQALSRDRHELREAPTTDEAAPQASVGHELQGIL
jgi:hypothetical protein